MSDTKERLLEIIAGNMLVNQDHKLFLPEELGTMMWTGWKQSFNSMYPCGQILWGGPKANNIRPRHGYYVDIPSMSHGRFENGQIMKIDWIQDVSHHMDEYTTQEELMAWLKEGLSLLIDDVLKDNPWIPPLYKRP